MDSLDDDWDWSDAAPPPADPVAAGTIVAGKYKLEAPLGSGGMGTVWSCTHLALGERMAIKLVSTSTGLSNEVRARFVREARSSARLKSRFTVRVFDTGELPLGTPYIVMEYLDGVTLSQHLRRVGRLSLAETVRILSHVGRGLELAHEAGIVHRDIKPDNVFLAQTPDDGVVAKLFDFGVAKLKEGSDSAQGSETIRGAFVGTPQFMSPEQAMGLGDVDHRADIYSMGVLAHRMLTGKRLFEAASMPVLLMQICSGDLPKLSAACPEATQAVEAWFQRTCARERDKRYPSAAACVEGLVAAAGIELEGFTPAGSRVPRSTLANPSGTPLLSEPGTRAHGPHRSSSSVTPVISGRSHVSSPSLAGGLDGPTADPPSSLSLRRNGRRVTLVGAVVAGAVIATLLLVGRGPRSAQGPDVALASPPASALIAASSPPSPASVTSTAGNVPAASAPDAAPPSASAPSLSRLSRPASLTAARPADAPPALSGRRPETPAASAAPTTPLTRPAPSRSDGIITDVGY